MAKLIIYHAHPAPQHSRANKAMTRAIRAVDGITRVDLYADYPRFDIDADAEQARLLDHEVILFQFPLFWYSTPSIIKEWCDIVLEHGFAYGAGGTALEGKRMMLALTAAGAEEAYTPDGYQNFPLRSFLTPLEQTARLCRMRFEAPYVLYSALKAAEEDALSDHADGFRHLVTSIRDDAYDFDTAAQHDVVRAGDLTVLCGGEAV